VSSDNPDDGWDDAPDVHDAPDVPDVHDAHDPAAATPTAASNEGGERRKRRRRRRGGGEASAAPAPSQPQRPPPPRGNQPNRPERDRNRDRDRRRERDERDRQAMRSAQQVEAPPEPLPASHARGSQPVIARDSEAEHDEVPTDAAVAWGTDDGTPAAAVTLAPDLPTDAPADDPDPVTWPLVVGPGAQLGSDVATVVGVRFVPAGRLSWLDAGDADYTPGDRVMVDSERGPRLAWIATGPERKAIRDRGLRRVIRRASEADLRSERQTDTTEPLRIAKDKAAELKLPLKVFRVETTGGKLLVYYTSDDRLDLRDFVRDVSAATSLRLELRQLGVRDEAKAIGGIGSCGLTLCCTTWLPDFVPVSIKMAKDQGLVLSPTKVSGQCGRLKCCLVYEQAGYAELRKGLPKLGKRVIGARGEGRVVEVDVLRQRVRVSYGPGDTEVVTAREVKPMFPSGNQPASQYAGEPPESPESEDEEP
jgi:cell fate regulator YaaT (PSP1 superfamily)